MPIQGLSNVFNGPDIPNIGGMGTMFNDAFSHGMQQENILQTQQNQLQGQQNELATSGLNAAVANAQNTPEGIASIVAGKQGEAMSSAAQGEFDRATTPDKVKAALGKFKAQIGEQQVEAYIEDIQNSIRILDANGFSGFAQLSPEMKKLATTGGGDPKSNLANHGMLLQQTRALMSKDFQEKSAIKDVEGQYDLSKAKIAADAKITTTQMRTETQKQIQEAKTRLQGISDPKELDSTYLRETSKIEAARAKAINDGTMSEELDQQLHNQKQVLNSAYAEIRSKYKNAMPSAASSSPQVIQYDAQGNRIK